MRAYVFEPRENRQSSLQAQLDGAGIDTRFVTEDFFVAELGALRHSGLDSQAILISETDDVRQNIRNIRRAGCDNPLIVLRDFRNSKDTSALLDLGADDVIVSPIKGTEVLARINSIIRRTHGHASDSVQIGEMTAYFDGRDPVVSGVQVRLSRREHAIFRYLALNAQRVISKGSIYDAIYGMSADQPFDKVIDVYICKLRKKIAAAAESGSHYIETIHGRGYKLSSPDMQAPVLTQPDTVINGISARA
ncbi:MAG: response regulator transcription factor [Brevirhabdus sp.]